MLRSNEGIKGVKHWCPNVSEMEQLAPKQFRLYHLYCVTFMLFIFSLHYKKFKNYKDSVSVQRLGYTWVMLTDFSSVPKSSHCCPHRPCPRIMDIYVAWCCILYTKRN